MQQATLLVSSAPLVTLFSGTEYTSTAFYTADGISVFWWSIDISGNITSLGASVTRAWISGQKLFATFSNTSSGNRSNYVGEYAVIGNYTGSVATYTVPSGIPNTYGLSSPSTVIAEMYGGGNNGGFTLINLPNTNQIYYYCVAPNGGETYSGFAGQTRFRWDRGGCNNNQDQRGTGWTGLFNAHPYNNTTNYTDSASIIANSGIYGIAGGASTNGNPGGGTTGAGSRPGTQTTPGSNYIVNVNNPCANSCSDAGTSEAVFSVCPSRLIGQWIAGGFETCSYGSGGGGYYPGGSWTQGPCAPIDSGGGSGYVGSIAGSGSFTQTGTGSNPNNSPYFVTQGRIVFRIR